jgi:iron complex outermembrane recepter protein
MRILHLSVLLVLLLFAHTSLLAQYSGKISGRITRSTDDKPLANASVMLFRFEDSTLITTSISSNTGNFELDNVRSDNYYITITYTGFNPKTTNIFSVNPGQQVNLTDIKLIKAERMLQGITVVAKKPLMEVTADKTVLHVENSTTAAGSNAFEILQKSPGVTTDNNDNIMMKGRSGVRIYIDGRLVQMETAELSSYLRSINAADIDALEIITSPSARYDASGNAGIVNIRFKKNKSFGLNGNVSAGFSVGKYPKANSGFGLNYRSSKLNLFTNYSNSYYKNWINFNVYRVQNDSIYDQRNINITEGWSHNIKTGLDVFATKTQTVGIIATANFNDNTADNRGRTPISGANEDKPSQLLYADNTLPLQVRNINVNFNYRYADSTGTEFNFDADRGYYRSRRSSYQPNYYYSYSPEVLQEAKIYANYTPVDVHITTVKTDFEKQLGKSKLGAGLKFSNVKTDNTFDFSNVLNGTAILDLDRSNTFSYLEQVTAAYTTFSAAAGKKWKIQAGLRMEHTNSTGTLTRKNGSSGPDDMVKRKYTDFFPSVSFVNDINSSHTIGISFNRRIDRPVYQDLNPFENKLDELTYQKGNAFLQPQYANTVQLQHTVSGKYVTTLSYTHVDGFVAQIIDTVEQKRAFLTKKNLSTQDLISLNFAAPFEVNKWWRLFTNINLFNSHYDANLGEGKMVDINVVSGSFYVQNTFSLKHGYTAEVNGTYNAPAVWAGTFRSRGTGAMDIGIQKLLFDNRATIKLAFTDVLRTLRWKGTSNFSGTEVTTSGWWESRQVRLNFVYRFGNNQVKAARQRQTASDDEKKRTEGAGGIGNN